MDVAIDFDDVVYVLTERDNHHISLFMSEGHFLRSFGTQGEGLGQFNSPYGITTKMDLYNNVCGLV